MGLKKRAQVKASCQLLLQRNPIFDSYFLVKFGNEANYTACAFDIRLYFTPLGQARQLIETCGT
jgi:hypothetical protein